MANCVPVQNNALGLHLRCLPSSSPVRRTNPAIAILYAPSTTSKLPLRRQSCRPQSALNNTSSNTPSSARSPFSTNTLSSANPPSPSSSLPLIPSFAPPSDFDLRQEYLDSHAYVSTHFPELLDLVTQGTLLVLLPLKGHSPEFKRHSSDPKGHSADAKGHSSDPIGLRDAAKEGGTQSRDELKPDDDDGDGDVDDDGDDVAEEKVLTRAATDDVTKHRNLESTAVQCTTDSNERKGSEDQTGRDVLHPDKNTDEESERVRMRLHPDVVFLVGTAHLSKRSAEAVTRVIGTVRPDNVVVELCRSRVGALYSEPTSETNPDSGNKGVSPLGISGSTFRDALLRTLKLGGQTALLLRFALSYLTTKVSLQPQGVQYGAEFQAARVGSEDVGAQLVLGDRPIEITLRKAWRALGVKEKLSMLRVLFQFLQATSSSSSSPSSTPPSGSPLEGSSPSVSRLSLSEDALVELQKDDALSEMFSQLGEHFPSLLDPLIHERDAFLAWSTIRSKAVKGSKSVVSVMGRAHLRGVVYLIKHKPHVLRFPLVSGQELPGENGNKRIAIIRRVAIEVALALATWYLFDKFV